MASSARRNPSTQILQELEELSESLYQAHSSSAARRTASLALPRTSVPSISEKEQEAKINPTPRTRRTSLSPWRSRPKLDEQSEHNKGSTDPKQGNSKWEDEPAATSEKKGIWNWKPIRALSHFGMQKLSCLFCVEVVAIQNLPASMNGLRVAVCIRKKENRDGSVQTMPSRVDRGYADFEETLFIRCHVYFTPGSGIHLKFEPRQFLIYVAAVDADELDFGKSMVNLSSMIQDSIERSFQGSRIRQWDKVISLSGKAKGGELVLKLGFQIMEKEGGVGIYSQGDVGSKLGKSKIESPVMGRRQSKTSFSIPSPRLSSRAGSWTPSQSREGFDLGGIEELNLDAPAVSDPVQKADEMELKVDDCDLLEFDVVDKGVEIQDKRSEVDKRSEEERRLEENANSGTITNEVVKEVVQDQSRSIRLTELDSIAQQIKALESIMGEKKPVCNDESVLQTLDADEDKVTREFLQMLEDSKGDKVKNTDDEMISVTKVGSYDLSKENVSKERFLPDLGKGLGCVVQTRNGGFLAAMNPMDTEISRKDTAKLAMQMSNPMILESSMSGVELFQKMAAIGLEELGSEILSLMPLDEIKGKTAEWIAFEGIASQIIQGRNKEGASSAAARSMASVKSMVKALSTGRKERVSSGMWNLSEEPITADEILAFSLQKIESVALDALKIQADMAGEDAPFEVSCLDAKTVASNGKVYNHVLESSVPIEDWMKLKGANGSTDEAAETTTLIFIVQLRDPIRQFEAVGGPMITLIHATCVPGKKCCNEEKKYRLGSLQVGGVKVRSSGSKNVIWDNEKQRLTALQWLVANGIGKAGKRGARLSSTGPDLLWSISSRVMADMWLKPMRNPDVKFTK